MKHINTVILILILDRIFVKWIHGGKRHLVKLAVQRPIWKTKALELEMFSCFSVGLKKRSSTTEFYNIRKMLWINRFYSVIFKSEKYTKETV